LATKPGKTTILGLPMSASEKKKVSFRGEELELEFPCMWAYTVFAVDEDLLRAVVESIVGHAQHTLEFSHESKGGKYRSMHLEVAVRDDAHRLAIFKELHEHAEVAYVL
jgi:putative lipoic acid-binding regulatory protein